jgi:hypothetical protein
VIPLLAEALRPILAAELRSLMRGPGARVGQDLSRVGPVLREMCGIAPNDAADDALAALAAWLRARISQLDSEDVRICVSSALGLHESFDLPSTTARVRTTAQQLRYGVNTVWRRVDAGIASLAAGTTPADSVLHQLREHTNSPVELGHVLGARAEVRIARCFLIAAIQPPDQPNKVYALVRDKERTGAVSAIPAVRVRHVTAVPPAGSILRPK